jgi:hypothetical protein
VDETRSEFLRFLQVHIQGYEVHCYAWPDTDAKPELSAVLYNLWEKRPPNQGFRFQRTKKLNFAENLT